MNELEIAERLRRWFLANGMTQKDVAMKIGVQPPYLNVLLNGKKSIGKTLADKFHNAFGIRTF